MRARMRRVVRRISGRLRSDAGSSRAPRAADRKLRVLHLIYQYPNFSETYMHEEIRSLSSQYDIKVVTFKQSPDPRTHPFRYELIPYEGPGFIYGRLPEEVLRFETPGQQRLLSQLDTVVGEFKPDVMHGHYFEMTTVLHRLAERHQVPYTLRTHSQDVLSEPENELEALSRLANSPWCLRVLAFPGNRDRLIARGLAADKVVPCWPVVKFKAFYKPDPRPPTKRIMCAGPAIPKKAHGDFLELAAKLRDQGFGFDLYAKGPAAARVQLRNRALKNPARVTYADPERMPDIYPKYDWLVYPADREIGKVGLPVSIGEAMASGLGVCWQELPGRREEQLEYLGGAGFLFESIDELPAILSQPYPEEKRLQGLEAAKRYDIERHKFLLSEAWDQAISGGSRNGHAPLDSPATIGRRGPAA